ncbi:MAG: hypothetical protein AAF560_05565 [Acidobacteriota bacterium]
MSGLLVQPAVVHSQCGVMSTANNTFGATMVVYKYLSSSGVCSLQMSMNVLGCAPTAAPDTTTLLVASATAANPSCSWNCNCGGDGTIVIDSNDGLPVELMDFSIESEMSPGAEGDDADDEPSAS